VRETITRGFVVAAGRATALLTHSGADQAIESFREG
jgi:hypothetical protein